MSKGGLIMLMTILAFMLGSCLNSDNPDLTGNADYYVDFDFNDNTQGWEGGFADYPAGLEDSLKLSFGYSDFPANTQFTGKTMFISGKNPQKKLFYYVRNQIGNLKPNTMYKLDFEINFIVQLKQNDLPGHDPVYVKVGAASVKPDSVLSLSTEASVDQVTFNLDKGMYAEQDGQDMVVLGQLTFNNSGNTQIITGNNTDKAFFAKSDVNGKIWLLVGFDSTADAYLAFYFSRILTFFTEVK